MKIRHVILACVFGFGMQASVGQIGIGTTTPDASSVLDVYSIDKGVLLPRMSEIQRDAISSPAEGLMVYNLTSNCLEINVGTSLLPNWYCTADESYSLGVTNDCDANGFESTYVNSIALSASNKFSVTITNNSLSTSNLNFATGDIILSGVSGISVGSVNPVSATLAAGASQVVEYSLTGTPASSGVLTGVWTNLELNCTKTVNVIPGDATFTLPQTALVVSINDGSPVINIQGVVDNGSNQLTVSIPYTSGVGTYIAHTGTYILNNTGTSEGGDVNSFRLSYPSGTFSPSGNISVTIEVDGDGSFDAEKQLFGIIETIVTLDFQVNGNSKGNVNLDVVGGIPDRNFVDANHKFIYLPVSSGDGNTWLNNNLGANYANMNHVEYDITKQATAFNDHNAYGSLYQWGRFSDGHELINYTNSTTGTGVYGTTPTNATSDTPVDSLYIIESDAPFDWRVPQNDNLWQGESGINNPCPQGYRLPTEGEMNALISPSGENMSNYTSAANSSLALTASGARYGVDGSVSVVGALGFYWTSNVAANQSRYRAFSGSSTFSGNEQHVGGIGVRCIKD